MNLWKMNENVTLQNNSRTDLQCAEAVHGNESETVRRVHAKLFETEGGREATIPQEGQRMEGHSTEGVQKSTGRI